MHVCAFEEDTNLSPRTGSVIRESEESLDEHVREMIKAARIRSIAVPLLETSHASLRTVRFVQLLAGTPRRPSHNTCGACGSLCRQALGCEALQALQELTTREKQ